MKILRYCSIPAKKALVIVGVVGLPKAHIRITLYMTKLQGLSAAITPTYKSATAYTGLSEPPIGCSE